MKVESVLPDLKKTILLDAPIHDVWNTVATSEGIAAWFMPNTFMAVVGNEFTLKSPFGLSPCKVLTVDPPYQLTFSWDTSGWWVAFELNEVDGKTEFTLTHGGWGLADEVVPKAKDTNETIHKRMDQGWEGIVYGKLRQVLGHK
ncbi:SRPBCC family protein [Aureibacillus halotolerans]|uniref:Uncharacterized protein YndB with AHSA1/START domain n=1 Tax=Aureibacillus halotolerans TaxID=1508390 RepID=A0A4R6U071_9BACI|nr:SRPBCC domain-containing protein [Aureibacillus halotolerans]TDQ37739.1 uncharacterized protein YndB with AHSA1/START domain [Aureibacillus halotolerans]